MSGHIDVYECKKFLSRAKRLWLFQPDNPKLYKRAKLEGYKYYKEVEAELSTFMTQHLRARYEAMLTNKTITLDGIARLLYNQPIGYVYWTVLDMVNIWAMQKAGPVENLGNIAKDKQSVHAVSVTKSTNDGIFILKKQEVPKGQKTLKEIEAAWLARFKCHRVFAVLADMKDWGSRKQVMLKGENTYKSVLRGLWAKIKTFDDQELKDELVKRLWEECNESLYMCADGHVGRLVNVLIGFDEQFKSNISPKEYFQNNMALISKSSAPLDFKIEQAKKLMDDVELPQKERAAWLEAF